jgi:hypothetical protein
MSDTTDFFVSKEDFPLLLELVDERSGVVLWEQLIEAPLQILTVQIPEPEYTKALLRMTYGDGRTECLPRLKATIH